MTEPSELRGDEVLSRGPICGETFNEHVCSLDSGHTQPHICCGVEWQLTNPFPKLLAPSELRGDVILRKDAVRAVAMHAYDIYATDEMDDEDMVSVVNLHDALQEIESLAPSVPEPPNDAELKNLERSNEELIKSCNYHSKRAAFFEDSVLTVLGRDTDDREWMSDEAIIAELKSQLSSAPTGLTRERLDEIFTEAFKRDEPAKQAGFEQVSWVNGYSKCFLSVIDAILESSSAPTPETEGS